MSVKVHHSWFGDPLEFNSINLFGSQLNLLYIPIRTQVFIAEALLLVMQPTECFIHISIWFINPLGRHLSLGTQSFFISSFFPFSPDAF